MMNLKIGKWKWSYLKQKEKWLCVKVLYKLQHSILTDQISRSVVSDSLQPHNGFLSRPKLTSFLCIWTDIIVCKSVPSKNTLRFSLLTSTMCFPWSKKFKKKILFFLHSSLLHLYFWFCSFPMHACICNFTPQKGFSTGLTWNTHWINDSWLEFPTSPKVGPKPCFLPL